MVTEPKSGGKSEVNDSNNDNKKRLLTPGFINDIDNGSILWTGGLKQELGGSIKEKAAVMNILRKTYDHMSGLDNDELKENCKNKHERCAFWSSIGECENNPSYMTTSCAPACITCDLLIYENRCPPREDNHAAYAPGDLEKIFGRIKGGDFGPVEILNESPFVATFENFLTSEECDRLIELGHNLGYSRSTETGAFDFAGNTVRQISKHRTSSNAWCTSEECSNDPLASRVMQKIVDITGTPDHTYQEHLQILKYEKGEFYKLHHDYIDKHKVYNIGPRVFTFFLYLSDVEEGGGTRFSELNITVMPKKGKALIWPSVKNEDPMEKDGRTMHEAMPITKGNKYAANAWVHMFEYKSEHKKECTG